MTPAEFQAIVRARKLLASGEARRVRKAAGMSLAEVADTVGVHEATISRWETSKERPRERERLLAYAALLDAMETA